MVLIQFYREELQLNSSIEHHLHESIFPDDHPEYLLSRLLWFCRATPDRSEILFYDKDCKHLQGLDSLFCRVYTMMPRNQAELLILLLKKVLLYLPAGVGRDISGAIAFRKPMPVLRLFRHSFLQPVPSPVHATI